jgi:hypothetical protein
MFGRWAGAADAGCIITANPNTEHNVTTLRSKVSRVFMKKSEPSGI